MSTASSTGGIYWLATLQTTRDHYCQITCLYPTLRVCSQLGYCEVASHVAYRLVMLLVSHGPALQRAIENPTVEKSHGQKRNYGKRGSGKRGTEIHIS